MCGRGRRYETDPESSALPTPAVESRFWHVAGGSGGAASPGGSAADEVEPSGGRFSSAGRAELAMKIPE